VAGAFTGSGPRSAPRLIVLGRQGAGKGTQCARLATRLAIPHLSTGDLFRAEIAAGTPLGAVLGGFVGRGELVPDEIVLDTVAARLGGKAQRARGYLLDGFPRTQAQAQALFEVLGAGAAELALEIDVPTEDVLPRLASRRVCTECGTVTNLHTESPSGRCPACHGFLERRADDHPEAIARRLAQYDEQAGPLLGWLDDEGLLVTGGASPTRSTSGSWRRWPPGCRRHASSADPGARRSGCSTSSTDQLAWRSARGSRFSARRRPTLATRSRCATHLSRARSASSDRPVSSVSRQAPSTTG
jgi:adenylate kinase